MVDVETERKAPAPGLKEKDEEEKSGIGTKEKEEEEKRMLDRGCTRQVALTMDQEPLWGLPAELPRGRVPEAQREGVGK